MSVCVCSEEGADGRGLPVSQMRKERCEWRTSLEGSFHADH